MEQFQLPDREASFYDGHMPSNPSSRQPYMSLYHELKAQAAIRRESQYVAQPSTPPGEYSPKPVFLKVPYSQKDAAKALGAKWDKIARSWFVPAGKDVTRFQNWIKIN